MALSYTRRHVTADIQNLYLGLFRFLPSQDYNLGAHPASAKGTGRDYLAHFIIIEGDLRAYPKTSMARG